MSPEVGFSLIFVLGGVTIVAVQPAAWPGAAMMALIGAAGLWGAARTAWLRRKAGGRP
jgi:hypothetical protein